MSVVTVTTQRVVTVDGVIVRRLATVGTQGPAGVVAASAPITYDGGTQTVGIDASGFVASVNGSTGAVVLAGIEQGQWVLINRTLLSVITAQVSFEEAFVGEWANYRAFRLRGYALIRPAGTSVAWNLQKISFTLNDDNAANYDWFNRQTNWNANVALPVALNEQARLDTKMELAATSRSNGSVTSSQFALELSRSAGATKGYWVAHSVASGYTKPSLSNGALGYMEGVGGWANNDDITRIDVFISLSTGAGSIFILEGLE